MNNYITYFQRFIDRLACIIIYICIATLLFDLILWQDEHPAWVIYLNFPVLTVSIICIVLSIFKYIPFRVSLYIVAYTYAFFFYLPGFIEPALTTIETFAYFSKLGTCLVFIFCVGLLGGGRQVLYLGALNSLLYIGLSYLFYTKQGVFFIDYINLSCFISVPIIIHSVFNHIDDLIRKNEENKQRLQEAKVEILQLRINEENKRNHYLSLMQQTNAEFIDKLDKEIDLTLVEKDRGAKNIRLNNMKQLCNTAKYTTEKNDSAQWLKYTNSDFITALEKYYPSLNTKEQYICSLIRTRLSSKEIAVILNVSNETVKWYRKRIRKKLNLDDSASLVTALNNIGDKIVIND